MDGYTCLRVPYFLGTLQYDGNIRSDSSDSFRMIRNIDGKCGYNEVLLFLLMFRAVDSETIPFQESDCNLYHTQKGPQCLASFLRFYWKKDVKEGCIQASYGGCRPTANNFETLEECQAVAGSMCTTESSSGSDSSGNRRYDEAHDDDNDFLKDYEADNSQFLKKNGEFRESGRKRSISSVEINNRDDGSGIRQVYEADDCYSQLSLTNPDFGKGKSGYHLDKNIENDDTETLQDFEVDNLKLQPPLNNGDDDTEIPQDHEADCLRGHTFDPSGIGLHCMSRYPIFFWDISVRTCIPGIYGGCGKTENWFLTMKDCLSIAEPACQSVPSPSSTLASEPLSNSSDVSSPTSTTTPEQSSDPSGTSDTACKGFSCSDGSMCIKVSQLCDKKKDCADNSDEKNCTEQQATYMRKMGSEFDSFVDRCENSRSTFDVSGALRLLKRVCIRTVKWAAVLGKSKTTKDNIYAIYDHWESEFEEKLVDNMGVSLHCIKTKLPGFLKYMDEKAQTAGISLGYHLDHDAIWDAVEPSSQSNY